MFGLSVANGKLIDDIQIFNHVGELFKANLSIEVLVCLDDRTVDKLLKLDIVQVASNHHLKHVEKLSIRNVSIVVNIVDLEGKSEFLLLRRTCRERVETLYEFKERNAAILVLVEHSDYALH